MGSDRLRIAEFGDMVRDIDVDDRRDLQTGGSPETLGSGRCIGWARRLGYEQRHDLGELWGEVAEVLGPVIADRGVHGLEEGADYGHRARVG